MFYIIIDHIKTKNNKCAFLGNEHKHKDTKQRAEQQHNHCNSCRKSATETLPKLLKTHFSK